MRRLLIFGDSYVAAADNGRPGYARLTPILLGMRGGHMGLGGTGFVRANGDRLPYESRLPALLAEDADVVVVQGTGNDAVCDPEEVQTAATAFLAPVVERFPAVYLTGPMWAKDGADHLPAIRHALKAAAGTTGARFVEVGGWVQPRHIGEDGAHPTWKGHAVIAVKLARAISRSSIPRRRIR